METVRNFIFLGSKITADGDCSHEIKRHLLKKSYDKPRQHIKKQKHYFANKGPYSQSYGFPVVMYRCDMYSSHVRHKDDRVLKNWWFWIAVLEKTLESPLDSKVIKPVNLKGYQPWIFIGRTDAEAEAEAPILWPSDMKSCLIGNDPDPGKDWG